MTDRRFTAEKERKGNKGQAPTQFFIEQGPSFVNPALPALLSFRPLRELGASENQPGGLRELALQAGLKAKIAKLQAAASDCGAFSATEALLGTEIHIHD